MPRCGHQSYKINIIDKEEPNYYSRKISTFYNYDGALHGLTIFNHDEVIFLFHLLMILLNLPFHEFKHYVFQITKKYYNFLII